MQIQRHEPKAAHIRRMSGAGRFYPTDPAELREMINGFLSAAPQPAGHHIPKAIIAPHAGYIYSGPIAGSAYAQLAPGRETIRRVVLLGPSHFFRFPGVAVSAASGFETPLGIVPVDQESIRVLRELPQVQVTDEPHAPEHALEVHLPFLQVVLSDFKVVPIAVGDCSPAEVSEVLDRLWGGDETVLVVSSDLSHYFDSETARKLDSETASAITSLNIPRVGEHSACGRIPICGLLESARKRGLNSRTLDLRNSGDTAGPRNQVVGYGAFVFESA